MPIEETYSPMVHRINQGIRRRATHPNEPVAPPADVLVKYSNPPPELVSKTGSELNTLIKAAGVQKGKSPRLCLESDLTILIVPPKVKGKRNRETIKPLSGLNIEELLGPERRTKISKGNAISEFKQMVASTADNIAVWRDAANQMGGIIRQLIKESTGDSQYDRAMENMRVMRYELIECEEPDSYNNFIRDLKKDLLNGSLGDNRKDLWFDIKKANLGLVDIEEAPRSEVLVAEATEVCDASFLPRIASC
jgi:ATP-dependent DNA helicase 2 subunit 2